MMESSGVGFSTCFPRQSEREVRWDRLLLFVCVSVYVHCRGDSLWDRANNELEKQRNLERRLEEKLESFLLPECMYTSTRDDVYL